MTSPHSPLSRRHFLTIGAGALGSMAALAVVGPSAQAAPSVGTAWKARTSQNGWPIVTAASDTAIEGSIATMRVADGDARVILEHVARRFNYEIATLLPGDVAGHTTNRNVDVAYESNYLSGTAIAIRPGFYPVGVAGGYFAGELVVIRDILAECEGVVRWGGDEDVPKESHFQLDYGPKDRRVQEVAAKIASWAVSPGEGAGTVLDTLEPSRRQAARDLERRQND